MLASKTRAGAGKRFSWREARLIRTDMKPRVLAALLIGALSAADASAQRVWVVDDDGGPGVHFTGLQPAFDGAAAGDTVLVRTGAYAGTAVLRKALRVVADAAAAPVAEALLIRDVADAQGVVVHGLALQVPFPRGGAALEIAACQSTVWIEDCAIAGPPLPPIAGGPRDGMWVHDSAAVVLLRSQLVAGPADPAGTSAAGLRVERATVHAIACAITGGAAGGGFTGALDGGTGLSALDATVHAQDCVITGGAGSPGFEIPPFCVRPSGNGGPGLTVAGAASRVELLATDVLGGPAGAGTALCPAASTGPATAVTGGEVVTLAGSAPALYAATPVRTTETLVLDVVSAPGSVTWIVFGPRSAPVLAPTWRGPLLVDPSALLAVALGSVPNTGMQQLVLPLLPLPVGVEATVVYAQVIAADLASGVFAGSAQAITLLAPGF